MTTELQQIDVREKPVEFVPFGAQDKIRLTMNLVKNTIAVPTKSGKTCSDKDATKFLMFCMAQKLNPFDSDCFLIGYDSDDGVAKFNMIAAEKSLLKRAELHPEFDGMQSGLTIVSPNDDAQFVDLEGELVPDGSRVVAGWCRVFFKTRKVPCYDRLPLAKMAAGKFSPFWKSNPEHQITKCARAAVLRRAFPTSVGGMYLREEFESAGTIGDAMEISSPTNGDAMPKETLRAAPVDAQVVNELQTWVQGEGFTLEQLNSWAVETGNFEEAYPSFIDIPEPVAKRLLRAKTGLKKSLELVRDAQSNVGAAR